MRTYPQGRHCGTDTSRQRPNDSSSLLFDPTWSSALEKAFKHYPLGYFHMAIGRTSKVAYAEPHPRATKLIATQLLRNLIKAVLCQLHTVLTDNGIQFTNRKKDMHGGVHVFDRVYYQHGIDHRLTQPNHPWTNGQVERMNRTIKDATRRYAYKTHQHLEEHLHAFLMAYNFAERLKTLRGLTPYEFVCASWQKEPNRFKLYPHHHTLGLNN